MGLTKAQIKERHDYLFQLYKEGYNVSEAMRRYDAKFGTHYSRSLVDDLTKKV